MVDDTFDTLFPGELPATGSTTENVLMIAGVLVLTGWFLSTVAMSRKPRRRTGDEVL